MPAVTRSPMSDDFELGHGSDDREHRPAHRAVGIDLILHADEADAEVFELLERGQQMGGAARETIELPDQGTLELPVAGGLHQGIEARTTLLAAGDRDVEIVADDLQAGSFGIAAQPIVLQIGLLIGRGNPKIDRGPVGVGHGLERPSKSTF